METITKNGNLHKAKSAKNDEFYTQLIDIEKEMMHYKNHFRGKVVYCNCDTPQSSNFFKYFSLNFEHLGLKKLITACHREDDFGLSLEYNGDLNGDGVPNPEEIGIIKLKSNGDFRSPESIELLKQADIVVTNPPFSLFREYVKQLIDYDKEFIIIGNMNAITYKEVFQIIQANKLWLGVTNFNKGMYFKVPNDFVYSDTYKFEKEQNGEKVSRVAGVCWFTNVQHNKRSQELILYKEYTPEEYPKYDNYDAINVDKVKDIPKDYFKVIGVPITFLSNHNPEQFEIVGCSYDYGRPLNWDKSINMNVTVKGVNIYKRLLIRNKNI